MRFGRRRRAIVLFVDQARSTPLIQLAGALRGAGVRPVCVQIGSRRRRLLLGRLAYGTTLRADRAGDLRRLERLVDSGRVIDVQANELDVAELGRRSRCRVLIERAMGPGCGSRWRLFDKLDVSERLAAGGVRVPPFVRLDAAAGTAAADAGLEYPLVGKHRISAGGRGIVVAGDRESLAVALSTLTSRAGPGSPTPPVFVERFLPGEIVQYNALIGPDGIELEICVLVAKSAQDPFGPSVSGVTVDDPILREAGRQAVAILGCTGIVNLEFIRDGDGRVWHTDLNTRAFGNIASLADAGVDLIGGYLWLLGTGKARPRPCEPAAGQPLCVFPASIKERRLAVGLRASARTSLAEIRAYRRTFGVRYLLVIGMLLAYGRAAAALRRGQAPLEAPARKWRFAGSS